MPTPGGLLAVAQYLSDWTEEMPRGTSDGCIGRCVPTTSSSRTLIRCTRTGRPVPLSCTDVIASGVECPVVLICRLPPCCQSTFTRTEQRVRPCRECWTPMEIHHSHPTRFYALGTQVPKFAAEAKRLFRHRQNRSLVSSARYLGSPSHARRRRAGRAAGPGDGPPAAALFRAAAVARVGRQCDRCGLWCTPDTCVAVARV